MTTEPLASQALILELIQQLTERIDGGHGRVRQSINEMKADMRDGFGRLEQRIKAFEERLERHSGDLLIIQTERKEEKEQLKTRRQDQRDRTVLITALTSIVVTIGIFLIKAILHL